MTRGGEGRPIVKKDPRRWWRRLSALRAAIFCPVGLHYWSARGALRVCVDCGRTRRVIPSDPNQGSAA